MIVSNRYAFTLIELLVVISIISLLASVVLGSLSSARNEAKVAAVQQEAGEMVKLWQLEYGRSGSYSAINQTINNPSDCNNLASGPYESQAEAICTSLMNKVSNDGANGDIYIYGSLNAGQSYSIMVRFLPKGVYCIGSSGRKYYGPQNGNVEGGCFGNP